MEVLKTHVCAPGLVNLGNYLIYSNVLAGCKQERQFARGGSKDLVPRAYWSLLPRAHSMGMEYAPRTTTGETLTLTVGVAGSIDEGCYSGISIN